MGRDHWEVSPRTLTSPSLFVLQGEEEGSRESRKIEQGRPPRRRRSCPREIYFYPVLSKKDERKDNVYCSLVCFIHEL
ncbi:hypothetical protein ACOSQ3_031304 [Xanthoceras sorbifolium]